MSNIINLRSARKAKARAEKGVKAAENRAKFGRTKAERQHDDATKSLQQRQLDAKKIDQEKS